jgi:hypothetical protein
MTLILDALAIYLCCVLGGLVVIWPLLRAVAEAHRNAEEFFSKLRKGRAK